MAPSDGTTKGLTSAISLACNRSTEAAATNTFQATTTQRRYYKLSLGRKRMRFDGPEVHNNTVTTNSNSDDNSVKNATTNPPSKKIRQENGNGMNGHNHHKILDSGRFSASSNSGTKSASSASSCQTSIASLCNLGNTCFLNSVLYTLRFTPGFLHNFHHLVADLGLGSNGSNHHQHHKDKRGNRNVNGNSQQHQGGQDSDTERAHDVIEQLHDLFRNMSSCDDHLIERESGSSNGSREPIPPSNFLTAVGKYNSRFEGNQQQDAHELLFDLITMLTDIKTPIQSSNNSSAASSAVNQSEEDSAEIISTTGKKNEKKKNKKSFLTSNGHISSSSSGSSSGGVKLVSSTPKAETVHSNEDQTPATPSQQTPEPASNFVRENFEGKTVFRTKCLECETSTYRSDKFTHIDIPLTFDDDLSETMSNGFLNDDASTSRSNGALSVADLFLKQIMASETLRENNKYLCAECSRLNEAQRSVQYELLPTVLVLTLKRFTAAGNKINDFVPTPFTMNCFCTQCMPPDGPLLPPGGDHRPPPPRHHYRLFAVIMHLGATLASGHYVAYVRASVDLNVDYSRCPKAASQTSATGNGGASERGHKNLGGGGHSSGSSSSGSNGGNGKKGIMKYFSRSSDSSKSNGTHFSASSHSNSSLNGVDGPVLMHCRSANCCGMLRVLNHLNIRDAPNHHHHPLPPASSATSATSAPTHFRQRSQESLNSSVVVNGNHSSETDSLLSNGQMEDIWLECDDENISVISRRQFEDELNSKQSAATPYLLFYERI